jgi:hypothetical protein
MRYDYSYIEAVQAKARRERAEAVHRLIIAPILALFSAPKAEKRPRHAARPHLARQG